MSIQKVREYLKQFGADNRIIETALSSATVELAAQALGVDGARIAKSISFKVNDKCILIVCAGDVKIDNPKYKAHFHTKAKMLSHDETQTLIGHTVGGVCPFAVNEGVDIYLDKSLERFETVFPACGSSNSAIELTLKELYEFSGAKDIIDVCKEV